MNNGFEGRWQEPAEARTEDGRLAFRRVSGTSATLDLEYRTPEMRADLPGATLQAGVAALCEAEVEAMRGTLSRLGEELAGQLSAEGTDAPVKRRWSDQDERSWRDGRGSFVVRASRYTSSEHVRTVEGAADAPLVAEIVRQTIEQRESGIRTVYGQVLADALDARGQAPQGGLPSEFAGPGGGGQA